MKIIAKPNTWFDAGTEVKLIDDYRTEDHRFPDMGLFEGLVKGKLDEEVCDWNEFEIIQ